MSYQNNPSFFIGVVEDRHDPLKLGRCRVRVMGLHTHDTVVLPTSDLPWAYKIQPTTSGGISGIGYSPVGVMEGTWVIVQYIDVEKQIPFVVGVMGGIPQDVHNLQGFKDPNNKYPLETHKNEPDTNRLARHEKIDETIVPLKEQSEHKSVTKANGKGSWDQSPTPYNAEYPFNNVWQSESGHIMEYDDTEGRERIHLFHRTGTFSEIDHNGTKVTRIVGDSYELLERNGFVHIRGNMDVCVEGAKTLHIKDTLDVQVHGKTVININDAADLNVAKDFNLTVGGNFNINVKNSMGMNVGTVLNQKSGAATNIEAGAKMSIKSNALIGIDGTSVSIMNGVAGSASPASPTFTNAIGGSPINHPVLTVNKR